ncbi:MAG: hypothetical protein ACK4R6_11730 [Spirosomataceae bacterium]
MKVILVFLVLTLGIFGCSLFVDSIKPSISRIYNNSEYDVKVLPYSKGKLLPITNQDTIIIKKKTFIEKINIPRYNLPILFDADSIIILFENKKIIVQYCNELKSNIVNPKCNIVNDLSIEKSATIETFKKGKYESIMTHYITNDDYDRAVDL